MNIRGKKISIIGAVRSGIGAAKLVKKSGGVPFVSDMSDEFKLKDSISKLQNEGINFETGGHTEKVFDCDMMVVSPGVPSDSEVIKRAYQNKIKIISELELAGSFCKGQVVAITGTNGKTTTTALCGHLFNNCGYKTYTAGNIGVAFSEIALDVKENEFVALEVSSFQLDLIDKFKPKVAMILNITPDHLNRYENKLENYIASKFRIYKNQDENDYLILNKDDETITENITTRQSKNYYFSLKETLMNGCYKSGDQLIYNRDSNLEFAFPIKDMQIKGNHNAANAMAVITAAKIFNFENEKIKEGLKTFKGVEHRLELVRELGGVKYINDSKATNVDSVWYALQSFDEPIFLILGGQDKGNDYSRIKNLIEDKVKKIFAIGSSAEKVFNYFHSTVKVELKVTLEDVINSVSKEAKHGEVVLLSPACASFDMFDNYEHRGKVFKEAVNKL
ncbi:MAG TPA: UDP-N-acetylmuramoyl-L-alanine--D-glutamate ligase [Ignavibacteriaceae bacterium]|nr:UDP-N-acetylmuramoyl-L-alanine--D-glutamate ligase [Ignavibacteriaceae bacterium]